MFARDRLDKLHDALGMKRLNRTWAKLEILLGLLAVGIALMWPGVDRNEAVLQSKALMVRLSLFILGGYLTLAGHRSHLYQSNNELTAYLSHELQQQKEVKKENAS